MMMNSGDQSVVKSLCSRPITIFLVVLIAGLGDATQSSITAFTSPQCRDVIRTKGKSQSCCLPCTQRVPSGYPHLGGRPSSSLSMSLPDDSSLQPSRRTSGSKKLSFLKASRDAVASNVFTNEDIDRRQQDNTIGMTNSVDLSGVWQVMSAACLITGNTVGASIMVLPSAAAGPGLALSSALWVGVYVINLLSGLLIAEVAINQKRTSDDEVPSSFKDFVDSNLNNPVMGNCVGITSVFVNSCVLAFSLMRAGDMLGTNISGLDSTQGAIGFSAVLAGILSTQSNVSLSRVTSGAVSCLFATFAMLLLPGLASVQDPVGVYLAPGTTEGTIDSILTVAPVFIQCAIWQNIAPSVTRLLDYDRTKTALAMVIGGAIPILMDFAWSLAVLGGGVDMSVSSGGPVLLGFMAASLVGSSIACGMSIAGELDSILPGQSTGENESSLSKQNVFPLASVLLAVAPSLAAGLYFAGGEDFTAALTYAGAYGSPLLYGILPVVLVLTQRSAEQQSNDGIVPADGSKKSMVPGGMAGITALAGASVACVIQQLSSDLGSALSSVQTV